MRRGACFISAMSLMLVAACSGTPAEKAERTLTSTVTLTLEDTLAIDTPVKLVLSGEPRLEEIYVTLNAVVTASTSTRAEAIANMLAINVERRDRTVAIVIPQPMLATLSGELRLRVPADLKLDIIERNESVEVSGMNSDLRIASRSHVRVVNAKANVTVGVVSGNALVDVDLDPGANIEVSSNTGDVELAVPQAISANLIAMVMTNGTIVPNHPQLPPYNGRPGQPYRVIVGDGLSAVALQTGVGNIVIRTR